MQRRQWIKQSAASALLFNPSIQFFSSILDKEPLRKQLFGDDFLWGVSTAATQIEGAAYEDGKTPSIWDYFSNQKGKIKTAETPEVACDFYHRYTTDIALIKELGFQHFRFSISWSRVLPNGIGSINQKGIDFYHKIIDHCLELNITPWVTLYHWDLPQCLQEKGGWMNREVIHWFSEYVTVCSKAFGDKVKNWMVLNEPLAYTSLGYLFGVHAPGLRGFKHFLPTVHHTVLCQAEGGRILRDNVKHAHIGTTFSCSAIYAYNETSNHSTAVKRYDAFVNRLFIEPALGLGYPVKDLPLLKHMEKYNKPGDEEKVIFDFDFIGLQNYTRYVVKENPFIPYIKGLTVSPKKLNHSLTEMNWEVYPEGIYRILKQFSAYVGIKKIIITENGAAFKDIVDHTSIHDKERIAYFENYLSQVLKAQREGVNVKGYFIWSLLDNFEWAEGYRPRFGLVYVDFATQKRMLKDSAYWFKDFLQ